MLIQCAEVHGSHVLRISVQFIDLQIDFFHSKYHAFEVHTLRHNFNPNSGNSLIFLKWRLSQAIVNKGPAKSSNEHRFNKSP